MEEIKKLKLVMLYFLSEKIRGDYDYGEVPKYVVVDGVYYDLDCHVNARGLLACAANINKNSIGSPAQVFFGDFTFESIVPEGNRATSYCYGVFDYDAEEIWQQFTTHCQSSPANVGDITVADPP